MMPGSFGQYYLVYANVITINVDRHIARERKIIKNRRSILNMLQNLN